MVQLIQASDEGLTVAVENLYTQYLKRQSDALRLAYYKGILQAGGTLEQVAALMVGSAEYYALHGGTQGWLQGFYQDAFGRPIDSLGLAYGEGQLAGGKTTLQQQQQRIQLATTLFNSGEYRFDLVNATYQRYLARSVDGFGAQVWTSQLQEGVTDQAVLAQILANSSNEFASKINA